MDERSFKRFSGDDDDAGKALKRWQAWATAKMMTVKDLSKQQRGPWLFTLLEGKALEACEHLSLEELSSESGEAKVWQLLKERFPEKEPQDQMGEALGEVFALAAKDGESMKEWTARVVETFERCRRKANVDFPKEARGWIALHCAGFNEEQKAIVKAKTQGKMDVETVSAGIRSCFPSYKATSSRAKRPTSVMLAEDDQVPEQTALDTMPFDDVEAFLADHDLAQSAEDEALSEAEAAEALAVTWKERRLEINRLNKSRQFQSADAAKRSFRVEIEELKKRTKCNKCGRTGHWARECRARTNASGKPLSSGNSSGGATSSAPQRGGSETLYVEAEAQETITDEIFFVGAAEEVLAATLISSPGFGVLDSGCGKTLIGEDTLDEMATMLQGRVIVKSFQQNSFRFGNGDDVSESAFAVAELFSPGWDLLDLRVQREVDRMSAVERAKLVHEARVQARFAAEQTCCHQSTKEHGKCSADFARSFLKAVVGTPEECLYALLQDVECVNLSGFECLTGEQRLSEQGSNTAAEPPKPPVASESPLDPIGLSLKKLHNNLGHPSRACFLRVLRNSGASEDALQRASRFTCPTCEASKRPAEAVPANPASTEGFNDRIGMDVKYFQGWKVGSKIPCLNIVDYGSSFQQVIPLPGRDTGEMIRSAYAQFWLSWAGVPQVLVLDPSQPNLSEALCQACEDEGTRVCHIAAEAHWQIGKVERHGGLLATILDKVLLEIRPQSEAEWRECLTQAVASKNAMLNVAGVSPYQFVFGRNPRIPADLLQDSPSTVANDAVLTEPAVEAQARVRQAARAAVVAAQDNKALREALRARPRLRRDFESGQWVAYWRRQKLEKGKIVRGFRWYGPALVLGKVGHNVVIAHRRSILRCAPEQLRHATFEEQPPPEAVDAESRELLGMRQLLDKGRFPQNQLVDLTGAEFPPLPEESIPPLPTAHPLSVSAPSEGTAGQTAAQLWEASHPTQSHEEPSAASQSVPDPPQYAPVRFRTRRKHRPSELELVRPASFQQEDLSEMLQEVIPRILSDPQAQGRVVTPDGDVAASRLSSEPEVPSPREPAFKRVASSTPETLKAATTRDEPTEALFCQATMDQLRVANPSATEVEVLLAGFLQKRLQKELPATGNPPELQESVEEAKGTEWCTMLSKPAVKIHSGAEAERIRSQCADRFIGSRFVITEKQEDGDRRIKARWCLQGHLDPDFRTKVLDGACHSPTMSQLSRALLLQVLASKRWRMCLGDVKGAFLEAGAIKNKYRPLYARQPQGGIPGLDPQDVIEVTGNVYGLNDAPFWWWETFDAEARAAGFERSQFDNCVYFFREPDTKELSGILGAHVDDSITGGEGPAYQKAIAQLRARFPFRKWRVGAGEFCGTTYSQDPTTFEITFSQKEYSQHLRPVSLTKARAAQRHLPATPKEVSALRGLNGAANWLANQTRPDLAVQVSMSQQAFPNPTVADLLYANQLVQRARQFHEVEVRVRSIDFDNLCICMHSDAAWSNAKEERTQAGYVLAFAGKELLDNNPAPWSPFHWKSYRLHRVVPSTLGGEAQAFSSASAVAEWMSLLLAEARSGHFDLRECQPQLRATPIVGVTDCKSLYDHLHTLSSLSGVQDKRVCVDIAIIKQSMERAGLKVRWCPTELMVCDALTKDKADPADLLRAVLELGTYQLSSEAEVLKTKKVVRDRLRASRGARRKPE
ncbi:RE1 [Symbiodinium sp. CCMP2456]|nr:RE1 [Symbiodinium sp. CCMP2456]